MCVCALGDATEVGHAAPYLDDDVAHAGLGELRSRVPPVGRHMGHAAVQWNSRNVSDECCTREYVARSNLTNASRSATISEARSMGCWYVAVEWVSRRMHYISTRNATDAPHAHGHVHVVVTTLATICACFCS